MILSHVVEVDDATHGPLASVAAVSALRRSAAALGIPLGPASVRMSDTDPNGIPAESTRYVIASAPVTP